MDNRYYGDVINEMQSFLDENGFALKQDGSFENTGKSIKIGYDEPKQMYTLDTADIAEGVTGEYKQINAWLFDDSQNVRDAASVGIDFVESLRADMGIRVTRSAGSAANIELPSATKNGSVTINGFTKKVLDIFPAYKDAYKEHIAVYGNFLYLNFYGETLVPEVKKTLSAANKKQVKKLLELFEDAYVGGDRDTVNAVVAVLCAAAYKNGEIKAAVTEMLKENRHFLNSFETLSAVFPKRKNLVAALVKE